MNAPSKSRRVIIALLASAVLSALLADLSITTRTPWTELARMAAGWLAPALPGFAATAEALAQTLSYALLGVAAAAVLGLLLAFYFHLAWLRALCASLRAVHELFWGLLCIQLIGFHPLSGLIAIALPFSGIFAKVFAEMMEEARQQPSVARPDRCDRLSIFCYDYWPRLQQQFAGYSLYRLECGLRSSTILGFIGLPTLGFYLETAFMQGQYQQVAGLLLLFFALIASLRLLITARLLPFYLLAAGFYLWPSHSADWSLLSELGRDFIPRPLREHSALWPWLSELVRQQILPGLGNTLLVGQLALLLSGVLGLALFPAISQQFSTRLARATGHSLLIVLRSTPELIIAFALLLLWGPSMLPAVIALAIHNGAIIANLLGCHADAVSLRLDASRGFNRYSFEILPRIQGQFMAFLCYRWEVILRETAILGILGMHTLGFYIDSAFESFRLDVALLLIAVAALLNITVDALSRALRHYLHLHSSPQARTPC